jgi:hypothetical protein
MGIWGSYGGNGKIFRGKGHFVVSCVYVSAVETNLFIWWDDRFSELSEPTAWHSHCEVFAFMSLYKSIMKDDSLMSTLKVIFMKSLRNCVTWIPAEEVFWKFSGKYYMYKSVYMSCLSYDQSHPSHSNYILCSFYCTYFCSQLWTTCIYIQSAGKMVQTNSEKGGQKTVTGTYPTVRICCHDFIVRRSVSNGAVAQPIVLAQKGFEVSYPSWFFTQLIVWWFCLGYLLKLGFWSSGLLCWVVQ